mmetsp:Transcript_69528/g.132670  ORF Transcript_69528/g.132670 Transcript_69528/m.132670 type:complete len:169 (-) Transcript_69528:100-606(-)
MAAHMTTPATQSIPRANLFLWCGTDETRANFSHETSGDWSRCKVCSQEQADKQGNGNLMAKSESATTTTTPSPPALCTWSGAACVPFTAFGATYDGCTTDYTYDENQFESDGYLWCGTHSERAIFGHGNSGDWSRCKPCSQEEADKQGNGDLKSKSGDGAIIKTDEEL